MWWARRDQETYPPEICYRSFLVVHLVVQVQCDQADRDSAGGCATIGDFQLKLAQQLQPLFKKYGVVSRSI